MPADTQKVRALMESRGCSLRQIARKMKISAALLSKVSKGERGMGAKFVMGLRLLGEDPFSYVLGLTDVQQSVNGAAIHK